eukprot:s117_g29.t1
MASSLSAMNVGFFAYKPTTSTIHAGQEASDELHLLTLRTKTLLGGVAPHQHPLGPVWVETTNFIITMLQSKEASLTIQEYKVSMTNTGDFYPQSSIVEKNRIQRLANRKRKLEEDNHDLGKTMVMNKAEIAEIERQLHQANAEPAAELPGKGRDVSPGSVPFGEIAKFKVDFFGKEVTMKAAVQRGGAKKQRTKERILWPLEMVCGCENVNDAKHDHFDGSLNLASCHFVLWSWYLADKEWMDMLWEAACTVTIQLRFCPSDIEWALTLNRASEKLKTLSNNALSDTFVRFCALARILQVEKESDGRDAQLRFNNSLYNASMHKACMAVLSVMSEPGSPKPSAFETAIRNLEGKWGRDVLSNQYGKLYRLVTHAKTLVSGSKTIDEASGWLVNMLHLALNTRLVTCARATDLWLDRDRKHQKNGYWHACTSVSEDRGLEALDFLHPLVEKLPDSEKQSCLDAILKLRDPMNLWTEFLKPQMEAQSDEGVGEDDPDPVDVPESALDSLKSSFNKATGALLELIFDLMRGSYFQACIDLSSISEKLPKLVAMESQGGNASDAVDLSKDLKKLVQHVVLVVQNYDTNVKSVSGGSLPAPPLIQTLGSDGLKDEEAEARNRIWKQVQSERRKYVTFSCPKGYGKDNLISALKASGKVYTFSGQLNSNHRLFCGSADLLEEGGTEPWMNSTEPKADTWKGICEFMGSLTGPTDFSILFDGRMRPIRRINEDMLLNMPQTEEVAVIYSGGCLARALESAVLRFPVARSRLKICKKQSFNSCGEATNFQPTFSGVAFRSAKEIPLISLDEKKRVLGSTVPAPDEYRENHHDDQPLFWQESKPIALWLALLDELRIQSVFDVSAGSGALAEACLTRGIQYHGKEHMSWVQAISDRAACGLISVQGSTLFSDDLAKAVKERFPEILQALASDADEDEILEPDSDGN